MNDDKQKIKELEKEVAKLRALLHRDELTRVLNRKGVNDEFSVLFDEILYARGSKKTRRRLEIDDVAVVFMDLDDFKKVNDTYGHDAGDLVLQTAADLLHRSIRGVDKVGRYGGEEFVVVLVGSNEEEGYKKAEELRKSLNMLSLGKELPIQIKASMGVASLSESGAKTVEELVDLADKAMYEAKTSRGKNNTVKHSELG